MNQRVLFIGPRGPGIKPFSDPAEFAAYARHARHMFADTGFNGPHTFVIVLGSKA